MVGAFGGIDDLDAGGLDLGEEGLDVAVLVDVGGKDLVDVVVGDEALFGALEDLAKEDGAVLVAAARRGTLLLSPSPDSPKPPKSAPASEAAMLPKEDPASSSSPPMGSSSSARRGSTSLRSLSRSISLASRSISEASCDERSPAVGPVGSWLRRFSSSSCAK